MIKSIEHPKLLCPHCGGDKFKINHSIPIRANESKRIMRIERFFKCLECKKPFKTVEFF